jgi:hypothetical protein
VKEIKEDILATLAYFDLFKHPLTSNEIYLFGRNKLDQADIDIALKYLVAAQSVYQFGDYYTLQNNHMLVVGRLNGNQKTTDLVKEAEVLSNRLIRLPYVRGIAMLGSLSQNLGGDGSDIRLFIITAKNRLWIARMLIRWFKKLMSQPHLFTDYYIDEDQLAINEKNIYTAIEVVSLIPLQGDTLIEQFYAANSWTRTYLPNKIMRLASAKSSKPSLFKQMFEWLFNNAIGNAIDDVLMRVTAGRWQKKANAGIAMKAGKHYAKPDLGKFQSALLAQYQSKISQILIEPQNLLAN